MMFAVSIQKFSSFCSSPVTSARLSVELIVFVVLLARSKRLLARARAAFSGSAC